MVAVAEAGAVAFLEDLDAIEDAAADIGRALERVGTVAGDDDRLLPGLQAVLQPSIAIFAEQAAADRWRAHERDIEVDEGVAGLAWLGVLDRRRAAGFCKGIIDVADAEMKPAYRSVADETSPVADFTAFEIERLDDGGQGCRNRRAVAAADATASDELGCGADDTVAHHQHGDGCAAHDVDLRRPLGTACDRLHVLADQTVHGRDDARFRDTDQHDRLLVIDQLDAGDDPLRVDPGQQVDRLAGIADRVREIGVEEDKSLQLVAAVDRHDRRIALWGAEAVRSREEVRRR